MVDSPVMDAVPLDPGAYQGTYKLIGGQCSLDLVNTVSWPGLPREHDWFDPVGNVPTWAVAAGILDPRSAHRLSEWVTADAKRSTRELTTARRIRSTVTAVLAPFIRGETAPSKAVEALNRLWVRAASRRRLTADRDAYQMAWTFIEPASFEDLLAPAVLNAAEVLTGLDPARLGNCPACKWLFYDTTRNGRRTWCDMADCGSRAKARRHYQRHHS